MNSGLITSTGQLLALLNRGKFSEAVNAQLQEALSTLEAIPAEKGKAEIIISLKIDYQGGFLNITPSVKSKLPEEGFPASPFWIVDGQLSVQHPNQVEMFGGPRAVETKVAVAE